MFAPVRARCGGGAAAWVAGDLAAPGTQGSFSYGSRKYSALEGYDNNIGQYAPVFLPGEPPLTQKPGRPQSTGLQRVGRDLSDPVHINARFFCLGHLSPRDS